MKSKKIEHLTERPALRIAPREKRERSGEDRNPELIEKFYKQIINGFGYAYTAKI